MRRGLAPSRERAQADIEAGRVTVAGAPTDKPSRLVSTGDPIVVAGPAPRFVSRGGEKLEAALARFAVSVDRGRALDAGASTGGFTDCLLQRGAREVVAVDVGYGQLHERLRSDPRVRNLERTNVRGLDLRSVDGPFDLVVADLSFISLEKVIDVLVASSRPDGTLVFLVKPQFEAGRVEAARGKGVITDPDVWRRVLVEVMNALRARGAVIMGCMVSPIVGAEGNVEFLVAARAPTASSVDADGGRSDAIDLDAVIDEAIERQAR